MNSVIEGNPPSIVVDIEISVHKDKSNTREKSVRDEERSAHVEEKSIEESTWERRLGSTLPG